MQLTNENLIDLIKGNVFPAEHLEQLYNQNKGLLYKAIKQTVGISSPLTDDLLQEGYIILCNCVQNFDASQGVKFSSYYFNALLFGIYKYSLNIRAIKLPPNIISTLAKYKKLASLGMSESEMRHRLNITAHKLNATKAYNVSVASLNEPTSTDFEADITIGDTVADTTAEFENEAVNSLDDTLLLNLCKKILTDNEFTLIKSKYWEQMANKDIAQALGISCKEVSRLNLQALRKLRYNRYILQCYNYFSHKHIGINEFNATSTSEVERSVLNRLKYSKLMGGQ